MNRNTEKLEGDKYMERLDFSADTAYNATEAAIHLNRYAMAKPFCKGATVLDAACGEGYGSYLMKSWGAKNVEGIDISSDAIAFAKNQFKSEGLQYSLHTVEILPFEDNYFDLVVSLETMEHLENPELFLKEIKRVVKPDGVVILSCPNDNYYFEKDKIKNPFHKQAYTFFEFQNLAEKYLGNHVDYYLAFALNGFINIPYERRTEPERGIAEDALGMFHYVECDQTLCVPQDCYLNQWNSNYYLGIWGKTVSAYRYSAVVSPRETFINHKDSDYDLLYHLDEIQKNIEKQDITSNKEIETMKKTIAEFSQERERHILELERLQLLLELVKKERDQARAYVTVGNAAINRVASLESSRGVQFLQKWYSIKLKLRSIFKSK